MGTRGNTVRETRRIEIPGIVLCLLLFFFLCSIPVSASDDLLVQPAGLKFSTAQGVPIIDEPQIYFVSTPQELLNVSGVWKKISTQSVFIFSTHGRIERRTVIITNNNPDAPLTNLRITPLDLTSGDDRYTVPARVITSEFIPSDGSDCNGDPATSPSCTETNRTGCSTVAPGDFRVARIDFGLADAHSGEYTGSIQISANNSRVMLPVEIKIKDAWELPLFVLVFFTLISVLLSEYVATGKKIDKIKLKAGKLAQAFSDDAFLQNPSPELRGYTLIFAETIRNAIENIYLDLYEDDHDGAEKTYARTALLWNRWSNPISRPTWYECLVRTEKILKIAGSQEHYAMELKRIWIHASREFQKTEGYPEDTPDMVLREIKALCTRITEDLKHEPDKQDILRDLAGGRKPGFWDQLSGGMGEWSFVHWALAGIFWIICWIVVSGIITTVQVMTSSYVTLGNLKFFTVFTSPWILSGLIMILVTIPLLLRSNAFSRLSRSCCNLKPKFWLWIYKGITSTFLPALFLVFIGFTQLYSPNPTFGAKGAEDYITLVFWAFGSGPASAKFVQLVEKYKEPEDRGRGRSPAPPSAGPAEKGGQDAPEKGGGT